MKIAVMGTGMVGRALAGRLAALGHAVTIAGRSGDDAEAQGWAAAHGAQHADFAGAAQGADLVIFAVNGARLLDAAAATGAEMLSGKVVIDVTNPLDTSRGGMPTLIGSLSNTTSAAEELQKALPEARVVKTLNTMNCQVMVDPSRVPAPHDAFLCGDDAAAKDTVRGLLAELGWPDPIDLGPLAAARGMEGMMPMWLRVRAALGTSDFNWRVAR